MMKMLLRLAPRSIWTQIVLLLALVVACSCVAACIGGPDDGGVDTETTGAGYSRIPGSDDPNSAVSSTKRTIPCGQVECDESSFCEDPMTSTCGCASGIAYLDDGAYVCR
jgi:hypothetical protein